MRRGRGLGRRVPRGCRARPAALLTRDVILDRVRNVTVAPVTSTIRGIPTEVEVDEQAGLDHTSVVSCDNVTTVPKRLCIRRRGAVDHATARLIADAVRLALDLM